MLHGRTKRPTGAACVAWSADGRRAAHVQFVVVLSKLERLELELHPVRRRHSNEVSAVVIRTRVLNDVVFKRRVAGVCLRHTHAVLHEQLGAVRRQLLGVQLQAHVERSADGEVGGDLQRFSVIFCKEYSDIEREFDADLDVVQDVRRVGNDVYHLARDFVHSALHWQEILGEARHQWASAQRRDTEPCLERLPCVIFLRSINLIMIIYEYTGI